MNYNTVSAQTFLGWIMPTSHEKFSLPVLLGEARYQTIQAINVAARNEYHRNTPTMSFTRLGQMFFEAAEMTFTAMQNIRDPKARRFIVEETLLAMYEDAEASFTRGWSADPNLQDWLRTCFMAASFNLESKPAKLKYYIRKLDEIYAAGVALPNSKGIEQQEEMVAKLFIQQASKAEVNDQIALHYCDKFIAQYQQHFFSDDPKPSANITDIYRAALDESLARAANLNLADFATRLERHREMQKRYEQLIDKRALTQDISYAGKKSNLKKRKPN